MAGGAGSAAALSFDGMMDKDSADSTKGQYKSLSKHFVQFWVSAMQDWCVSEDQSVDLFLVIADAMGWGAGNGEFSCDKLCTGLCF